MSRTIANTLATGIILASGNNPVTITGTGRITDSIGTAIYGGTLAAGWTITNAGTIGESNGAGFGVYLRSAGTLDSLTNQTGGLITSAHNGLGMKEAGVVINQTNATIASTDTGLASAIYIAGLATVVNAGVVNAANTAIYAPGGGSVTNLVGGTISGVSGIYLNGSGTVTNAGTIIGTDPVYGAVWFKSPTAASRLVVDPGAVFIGKIVSQPGSTNVIELASSASAGTLSGFDGNSITNFATLQFDPGAAWTVRGNSAASGLGALAIAGFTVGDTIDLTGFVATSKTFASNALVLTNASNAHATLHIAGAFSSSNFTLTSDGSTGTDIAFGATAAAALTYGQTIDEAGIVAASETVTAGVMTLFNGGGTAVGTISVGTSLSTGDFILRADGSGGTNVIVDAVFGTYTAGVTLLANPTTITATGAATNTSASGNAVSGPSGTNWTVTNLGVVAESGATAPVGIRLAASGTVINAGSIGATAAASSGAGVSLAAGGAVTNQSGGAISGPLGVQVAAAAGTVVNAGTIIGNIAATVKAAVKLSAGGSVTNQSGGTLSGFYAIWGQSSAISVVNHGAIIGNQTNSLGVGVYLGAGGTLTNAATASITGANGVYVHGAAGTILNTGIITGNATNASNAGVYLKVAGSSLTNQSGGTITGFRGAVAINATVVNAGGLDGNATAATGAGVLLTTGGVLTNRSGGIITGFLGVYNSSGAANVVNSGAIAGNALTGKGISLKGAGIIANQAGGTISGGAAAVQFAANVTNRLVIDPGAVFIGTVNGGNTIGGVSISTLELVSAGSTGTLTGLGSQYVNFARILVDANAQWAMAGVDSIASGQTLTDGGTLSVYGTLTNTGSIVGANSAIALATGGQITNRAGGTIIGGSFGVNAGGAGTLINAGLISGGNTLGAGGVSLAAGAMVINQSGGAISGYYGVLASGTATVTNAGIISGISGAELNASALLTNQYGGTISGSHLGVHIFNHTGTVVNAGSIAGTLYYGVELSNGGTVANGGTISGGVDAVTFGAGTANRLIVTPGARFIGTVNGGNTIGAASISTLELASAGSTGTLSGFGGQYVNFGQVTFDAGAHWTLVGTDATTALGGATITGFSYGDTIDVTNFNATSGHFSGNHLTLTSGGSTISLDIQGNFVSSQFLITNDAGTGSYIVLQSPTLHYGDTLNETGIVATSETITAGTMTLFNAGNTAVGTIVVGTSLVTSDFIVSNDGTNSTVVLDTVFGTYTSGVTLLTNPTTIAATGTATNTASSGNAVYGPTGTAWTLVNNGLVNETAPSGVGVNFAHSGTITNAPGGTINGASFGIEFGATASAGVVTNQSGGVITGESNAIQFAPGSGAGTVGNSGIIAAVGTAAFAGINLTGGGVISNASGGTITGEEIGIYIAGGTVSNLGADSLIQGYVGVYGKGGVTVRNAGTIGSSYSAGVGSASYPAPLAIQFGTGTNRLIIDPSAVFVGQVTAAGTTTLELASAASAGTLSGLGAKYSSFGPVTIDSGAQWRFGGSNTLASGITLTDSGTLTVSGTLANAGVITGSSRAIILGTGGLISNQSSGTISATAPVGVGIFGSGAGRVVNAGSIQGNSSNGFAVFLGAGGSVTNQSGGRIAGSRGIVGAGALTVVNAGSIAGGSGAGRVGIGLNAGGTAVNQSGGVVTGNYGIAAYNSASTITNAGSVSGVLGVLLQTGGALTNQSGGGISGSQTGVVANTSATVVNAGSITGTSFGVRLATGGTVIAQTGGTISSPGAAALSFGTGYTGRLVVQPNAVFAGAVDGGNTLGGTSVSTLELASGASTGTFAGLGSQFIDFAQVAVDAGASWTFDSSSTLATDATLTNAGTILSSGTTGLRLAGGGMVNQAGGLVTNSAGAAVYGVAGIASSVVNLGTLAGDGVQGAGVRLRGGGSVTNQASGVITGFYAVTASSGTLTLVNAGSIGGNTVSGAAIHATNGGTVSNQAGGTISGYDAIVASGPAAVVNAGVIAGDGALGRGIDLTAGGTVTALAGGTISGGADALRFAAGFANRLTVDPGASFAGTVAGGNTIGGAFASTLELASGASTGTLSGLGSQFVDFAQTTIDAGANWALTGTNSVAAGASVTNSGTLTNVGTLLNSGTLTGNRISLDGGVLTNQASGVISASYVYGVAAGAGGSILNRGTIVTTAASAIFLRASGVVVNDAGGTISGYAAGVKIAGTAAAVGNLGTIVATQGIGSYGVNLVNGGVVINGQSGTAASTALIDGYYGVAFGTGAGTLGNYGTISGTGNRAVYAGGGGAWVVNGASNATTALIRGAYNGIDLSSGRVTNFATVIAASTATPTWSVDIAVAGTVSNLGTASLIEGYGGVRVGTGGTVINAGTIASNQGAGGAAVQFGGGNARLIDDPGAVFVGSIFGGTGGSAVLELASAASTGTITGLGTSVTNFTSLVFDTGAQWLVAGNDSAAGLGTLGISGFTVGDTIDLTGFVATSRTFSGNSLVLGDGAGHFATLAVQGAFNTANFVIAGDGSSGTDITVQPGVPPVITGASAAQAVGDDATVRPFSAVTVHDPNSGSPTETVTISVTNGGTLTDADGTLSGTGLTRTGTGTYQITTGSTAEVTAALNALVFTPAAHQVAPGGTIVTEMTLSVTDSLGQSVTDTTTSVIATAVNSVPGVGGAVAGQSVADDATLQPFSGVGVTDPDLAAGETVSIVLTQGGLASDADGALSGTGLTKTGTGSYVLAAGTPSAVSTALHALIFTPTAHQVAPGGTIVTGMTLSVSDGLVGSPVTDTTTSVVATAVNDPPLISGTVAGQTVADDATLHPFSAVGVADPDFAASETVTIVLTHGGTASDADGALAGAGLTKTGTGTYVLAAGTPAAVGTALDALIFTPTAHQVAPGGTITTGMTLSVTDGIVGAPATDTTTSVIATAVNTVPAVTGTVAGQSVADNATLHPFASVGVSDADLDASETVSIVLTSGGPASDANGALSGTGLTKTGAGTYLLTPGTPSAVGAALDALIFTPTAHQVAPGGTITTGMTLSVSDGIAGLPVTDTTTSVITTAANSAPAVAGTVAGQAVAATSTTLPFRGVTVSDPDAGASETVTIVLTDGGSATDADGALSGTGLSKTGTGTYVLAAGTPGSVSSELEALRFTPAADLVGQRGTITTGMTLSVSDGIIGSPVVDTLTSVEIVPCFAAGTRLRTPRGSVAVERLREGDMLLTVSGKSRPVQWIGRRVVDCSRHAVPDRVKPICIAPHAFGENRPSRALFLSPDHSVFVEGVLIPVKHLVNDRTVTQVDAGRVTYYHIELPSHDVVLAEGLPSETYLETGGRSAFEDGGGAIQLHPDFTPDEARVGMVWQNFGYAPLIGSDGQLDRVRAQLACQALMLGYEDEKRSRPKKRSRRVAAR